METLAQIYNTLAPEYERIRVPRFRPFVKKLLQLYDTRPGAWVLDAGCGTGLVSALVAPRAGHGGKVIGVDASEAMLEIARTKARGFGFDQCEFRAGDVRALDFPDDTFDLVVCSFALWGEPGALFQEFRRVLKPRGAVLLQNWGQEQGDATRIYDAVLAKYRVSAPDATLTEIRNTRLVHQAAWQNVNDPAAYQQAFRDAGFVDTRADWCALPMQFADANELRAYFDTTPWNFAEVNGLADAMRENFKQEAARALMSLDKGKIVLERRAIHASAFK